MHHRLPQILRRRLSALVALRDFASGTVINHHVGMIYPPLCSMRTVYADRVRYDRGATLLEPVDIDARVTLAYTQKAPRFAAQREYRIALFYLLSNVGPLADPSDEAIFVRLNRRLSYCELLSR